MAAVDGREVALHKRKRGARRRGERQSVLAEHERGHALSKRRLGDRRIEHRGVGVAVGVDETGQHIPSGGVDHRTRLGVVEPADGGDPARG